MTDDFTSGLIKFGLAFTPALFGIICHEVAHGYAAYRLGDPTAKGLGRLTLNPIPHIDPMGLLVFAFTAWKMPFVIGWAKPVPVQPMYFRRPRQGMMLVSAAGPLTNFLVALLCALIVKLTLNLSAAGIDPNDAWLWAVYESARFGVAINCALAWFNLMPVPPLDGSHIVAGLLPLPLAKAYASIGRYGMIILVLLLLSGLFTEIILPLIVMSQKVIFSLVL